MNKKIILSTAFILLIGLAVFVVAQSNDEDQISVSSNVEEGWNLVSNGIWAINPSQDSEIKIEDISAIYFYNSKDREYKRIYPLGSLTHEEEEEVEDKIMKENAPAAWIYSKKSGNLKFMTDDVYPINQRPLYTGWNLVSITPSFVADNTLKSLDYMKGSCNILNAYFWNPENKEWIDIPLSEDLGDVLYYYDRLTGYGLIIKVSNDCIMGSSSGTTTSPPSIPGSGCEDTDGGINYYVKGKITLPGRSAPDRCGLMVDGGTIEDDSYLVEGYCGDGIYFENYECPNGCQDGACI